MKHFISLILGIYLSFAAYAVEEDNLTPQHLLATGKFTGGCGIFRQMLIFQESTGLEGGDKFIARFLATEAARLGLTSQEYSEQCQSSVKTYNELWALFESAPSGE